MKLLRIIKKRVKRIFEYRWTASIVCLGSFSFVMGLVLLYPELETVGIVSADEKSKAIYESYTREIEVGFGDKEDRDRPSISFRAVPGIEGNTPREIETLEVEEKLGDRSIWEKAGEGVRRLLKREEKVGIEMVLVATGTIDEKGELEGKVTEQVEELLETGEEVRSGTELTEEEKEGEAKQVVINREIVEEIDARYEIIEGKGVKEEIVIRKAEGYGEKCLKRISNDEFLISNQPPRLHPPVPSVVEGTNREGGQANSKNQAPNEQDLEIGSCSLPKNTYTFELKLDEGVQLHQSFTGTGEKQVWYFTDKYGRYIGHFLPPFAVDGKDQRTNEVAIEIAPVYAKASVFAKASTDRSTGKQGSVAQGLRDRNRKPEITRAGISHIKPIEWLSEVFGVAPVMAFESEATEPGATEHLNLVLTVDLDWLLSPDRVYPIRIDPSIVHDTEAEFLQGTENRVEVTSDPKVQLTYHELPADEHTVGLWHMNNDWTDSSGEGNNGTAYGDAAFTTSAKLGSHAGSFDGTGDYVETGLTNLPKDITITTWFKQTQLIHTGDEYQPIVVKPNSSSNIDTQFNIQVRLDGTLQAWSRNTSDQSVFALMGPKLSSNLPWYNVTLVIQPSSTNATLYLNGVVVAETNSFDATYSINNHAVWIGRHRTGGSIQYWDGLIDEVAIHNRALTPAEIKAHAQHRPYGIYTSDVLDLTADVQSIDSLGWTEYFGGSENPVTEEGLVGWWHMNDNVSGDGQTIKDFSVYSNDGATVNGANNTGMDCTVDGKHNFGCEFDGVDDYISIADSCELSGGGDLSVSAWVYPKSFTNIGGIVMKFKDAGYKDYGMNIQTSQKVYVAWENGGGNNSGMSSIQTIDQNTWSHLTFTWDSTAKELKIYINGELDNSDIEIYAMPDTDTPVTIGKTVSSYYDQHPFDGFIDEVRIYSRTLGADEILSNYQAGNIEFQTRTGADTSPDDGSWEEWKPVTSESSILNMDDDESNWLVNGLEEVSVDVGDGSDGAVTLSTSKNLNIEGLGADSDDNSTYADGFALRVNAISGTTLTTTTTADSRIVANDKILLIDLRGITSDHGDVGNYEILDVSSVSGTSIIVDTAPTKDYDGSGNSYTNQKVVIQRIPQYTNVAINSGGMITTSAWDGLTATPTGNAGFYTGMVAFYASGTVTISSGGSVSVSQKGYRGGISTVNGLEDYVGYTTSGGADGSGYAGRTSNGAIGGGSPTTGAGNGGSAYGSGGTGYEGGGGGGGCKKSDNWFKSGGGGGGGASYTVSQVNTSDNFFKIFLAGGASQGTGGGGGGEARGGLDGSAVGLQGYGGKALGDGGPIVRVDRSNPGGDGGSGENGGGIVFVKSNTFVANYSNAVLASGGTGGEGGYGATHWSRGGGGGGGQGGQGGSGGSIYINSNNMSYNSDSIITNGGSGGDGGDGNGDGIGGLGAVFSNGNDEGGSGANGTPGSVNSYGSEGGGGKGGNSGSGGKSYLSSPSSLLLPVSKSNDSITKIEGSGSLKVQQGAPQVDSSTVALWHLDETNGDLAGDDVFDETANNNDGELNGTAPGPESVKGFSGKAREFNGSNDYVSVDDPFYNQGDNFTIDLWIKPFTVNTGLYKGFIGKQGDACRKPCMWVGPSGGNLVYDSWDSTCSTRYAGSIADFFTVANVWYHIAWVKSGTTYYFYKNGLLFSDFSGPSSIFTANTAYFIGRADNYFNGIIDEVRISNTARSAEEIAEAYRMGRDHRLSRTITSTDLSSKTKFPFWIAGDRPGTYLEATIGESAYVNYLTDANTVGLWHLEENNWDGTTDEVKDSSSYGNHGTASASEGSGDTLVWTKKDNTTAGTCDTVCEGNGKVGQGTNGKGDDNVVADADVLKDGDTYRMWYGGHNGSYYSMFNATSSDGLVWTKTDNTDTSTCNSGSACEGNGKMGRGTSGRGDDSHLGIYGKSVIKDGDIYKMWYGGYDGTYIRIYYATSPDSLVWTKYDNTIPSASNTSSTNGRIPLGSSGRGDDRHVYHPTVIKDGDTYKMWYIGHDGSYVRVYHATSPDGLIWTKYDNTIPADSNTSSTNGRIPQGTSGRGDDVHVHIADVIKDGDVYKIWYTGYDGTYYRLYYATSSDGLVWTKQDNTIPSASNTSSTNGRIPLGTSGRGDDRHVVYCSGVIKDTNEYKLYYAGHDGAEYRIYLATSPSSASGEPLNSVQGKIGKAGEFDGTDDYIDFSPFDGSSMTSGSLEAWFKTTNTNSTNRRILETGSTNDRAGVFMNNGNVYLYTVDGGVAEINIASPSTYYDNNWHYVVGTWDSSAGKLFIDGIEVNNVSGDKTLSISSAATGYIGEFVPGGDYYFNGTIDEVRISNIARSAEEIRQAYEIGRRTHPITIDFSASLDSSNLITNSSDLSFTIDATSYGFASMGDNIYKGDKIIVKENYGGTEYIAQGDATAVNTSTGAVTIDAWDTGATFPASGYTANASVFKWQREWFDITAPLSSHINATTNLTLRVTDGSEGRTFYLDDFKSGGAYDTLSPVDLTARYPSPERYFQYRAIFSTTDTVETPWLSDVTVNYTSGPALNQLMRHGKYFSGGVKQPYWWAR